MPRATVADRCYEFFRSVGLTTVFGNPGSTEEPFLKDFPADFRYVLGLQEAGVVGMAAGYALAGDRAALVNLHTAAGMGNAMGAIINAFHAKAPLLITAGQQHRAMEVLEPLLWGRQVEFARPYVKWSCEPHRAADVPAALARAHHLAMTEPRGPVFVSICMDGLDEECPAVATRSVAGRPQPDPAAVARVAEVLGKCRRIAIVAGEELDDIETWPRTVELAERLRAAVFGPPENFRNSFPTSHPQFRGFLPPAIGPLADRIAGYDALLVLGTRMFAYYPYVPGPYMPDGLRVFHVTSDPAEAARAVAGEGIVGCPRAAVRMLLERVSLDGNRPAPISAPPPPPRISGSVTPIPPAFVYQALAEAMPPHAIVVEESLSSRAMGQAILPRDEPGGFYCTGNGILGSALPMTVGVRLARPDRPVVCILGDGATQYSVQALWTAQSHRLAVVFVVMDNREYAVLKAFGSLQHAGGVPGMDLGGIDFDALARAYGLPCHRVSEASDLAAALGQAFACEGPSMVWIAVDPAVPPLL